MEGHARILGSMLTVGKGRRRPAQEGISLANKAAVMALPQVEAVPNALWQEDALLTWA